MLSRDEDVWIVRASSSRQGLLHVLNRRPFRSYQADTLLYFRSDAHAQVETDGSPLVDLSSTEATVCREVVKTIFARYANHYMSGPVFARVDVPQAYASWATTTLEDGSGRVRVLKSGANIAALAVTKATGNTIEVLLGGVVPRFRNRGFYGRLIRRLTKEANSAGACLVISTQVGNVAALRAWCGIGLSPWFAVNTYHAIRGPQGQ